MDQTEPTESKSEESGSDSEFKEDISWLGKDDQIPIWSRLKHCTYARLLRNNETTKLKEYDVEIEGRLWSLWGTIHPNSSVFGLISRGKQYLACCVLACCATELLPVCDWTADLLDRIVLNGDTYHRQSLNCITKLDYETSLEDLKRTCVLNNFKFNVQTEFFTSGQLYAQSSKLSVNLVGALALFFEANDHGILCWKKRCLTIGRVFELDGGYFLFDCQSIDKPLFPEREGASYLLRTNDLHSLIYCIVTTLDITNNDEEFVLYKVDVQHESSTAIQAAE